MPGMEYHRTFGQQCKQMSRWLKLGGQNVEKKKDRNEKTQYKKKKGRSWGTATSIQGQPRSNLEKLPAKSAPLELQPMSIADLACRGQVGQWSGRQVGAGVEKGQGRALTGEMGVVKWFVQR